MDSLYNTASGDLSRQKKGAFFLAMDQEKQSFSCQTIFTWTRQKIKKRGGIVGGEKKMEVNEVVHRSLHPPVVPILSTGHKMPLLNPIKNKHFRNLWPSLIINKPGLG